MEIRPTREEQELVAARTLLREARTRAARRIAERRLAEAETAARTRFLAARERYGWAGVLEKVRARYEREAVTA